MTSYIAVLLVTFIIMVCAAAIINFAKKKQRTGKHTLTGMCHKSGGATCSSCTSAIEVKENESEKECNKSSKNS